MLAKLKGLWSRKDQRNKALWLILWISLCNALLCSARRTFGSTKGIESIFLVFNAPYFTECFCFVYIFLTASLLILERNVLAFKVKVYPRGKYK